MLVRLDHIACLIVNANHSIYKRAKFEDKVSGVDVVFDTVGGDTQERAFQTLKRGGVLVSTVSPPSAEKAEEFGTTVAMVVMTAKPDQLAEIKPCWRFSFLNL